MSLNFIRVAAVKDLQRIRRDPFSFAMWLGIPIVLAVLLGVLFGRAPVAPQGRLLVADRDDSLVSQAFTAAFTRAPLASMVLVEKVPEDVGRARINRGEASAFLLIPKGAQQAFLRNHPVQLHLVTNPSQRILPQIIEETLSITVEAGFYVQKLGGDQLRMFDTNQPPGDLAVAQSAVALTQLGRSVRRYVDPPLIELETQVVSERKEEPKSFAAIFFPTTVFMSLMFICNGLALDIWKERMAGTLRRLAVTPVPMTAFLTGRLVTVAMILGAVAAVGLTALGIMANVPAERMPGAAMWLVLTGCTFYLAFLLLALQPATQRAASVWGNLVVLPLSMLGGGFIPFEMMPGWMARIGRLTPNGWALSRFTELVNGSATGANVVVWFAALAAISAVTFFLVSRSLRRAFAI